MNQAATSQRKIFIGYAVDIFGPLAAYWLTRRARNSRLLGPLLRWRHCRRQHCS